MKTFFAVILMLIISAMVVGCNTIEGVGKDIKRAGEALEDAAK